MSRSRKGNRRSRGKTPVERTTRRLANGEGPVQPARSILKDLTFGIIVCVAFFIFLESALRVLRFPPTDPFEDPFVGFSATKPLFEVKDGIASTSPSRLAYFNKESFAVNKPSQTFRIFCFGGSTTYGHPFDGRTAFPRWLQELLKASVPGTNFEVINAGGISYASYRIVPLIRETLLYHPDLMIIYTGQNEFLERRTYSGLFEQGGTLVTVRSVVENLQVYRALKWLLGKVWPGLRTTGVGTSHGTSTTRSTAGGQLRNGAPAPGKSMLKEEVTAILDRSAGLELYHRDEEFSRGVVEHFAYNLDAMVSLCSAARVPVFLVNPASNLKDFSPFKSEHTTGLTMIEKSKIDTEIARAADLVKKSQFDAALLVLDNAVREDPLFAETHFWRGRALLGKGLHEQARASFVKARDLDVCPLRCITPIEEKIAQIAERRGVPLIRFRESLERIAAETGDRSGVPGNESFLDHVHPTIERYQLLGEQLLQEMVERGMVKPSRELTAQDRSDVYRTVVKTLDPEFLASKDLNLAKTLRWAGKKDEAREALKRVAALLPGNAEVHKMMGSYLLDDANYDEAIQEYSEAVRLSGGDPTMEFSLAVAYQTSGRPQEAMEIYKRLADKEQTSADAAANLATLHLEQGRVELAQQVLEKGLKSNPESDSLFAPYGLALAMTGKVDEAIPWMLRAVRAEPGNPRHLYNLAGMYAMSGRTSEGLAALNQAVDKGYSSAEKIANDPVFASIRTLPEFSRILDRIRR